MFEDKNITIQKVKDLLYSIQNEFSNELDYDYDFNGRELVEDDFALMEDFLNKYINKVYAVIDDELVDTINDKFNKEDCRDEK